MVVYLLSHLHEHGDGEEDWKLLGVYATPELALEAQERAAARPGFCDATDGFTVDPYTVGEDHWTEGYVTV